MTESNSSCSSAVARNRSATLEIFVWLLCIAAVIILLLGMTVAAWLPYATRGVDTGALDGMIYTTCVFSSAACWLLAAGLALWRRKQLGGVRWLPLGVLVALIALKGLAYFGGEYQEAQRGKVAVAGDSVQGYLESENMTEDKAILVYFMDFPGKPPNDDELRKPVTVVEYTGRRTGGGGDSSLSPSAIYSLNQPKRLRWYIWHITQRGDEIKNKDGSTSFVPNILLTDPKIPVVVCEATVPVYVSPLVQEIYSRELVEYQHKSWKVDGGTLIASFYGDGRTFTLTAPLGITQNEDLNADILQHKHEGDCK